LRNPIATVHGYATILLRHSGSLQPAQQIRFLDVISRETSRLSSMVEDVLTVSRLDAGRLSYAFRPIDLTAIVAQTVDEVRGLDAAHEFQIDLPSELCIVNADGGRLKQAMINLLNNAIKYSPHGERIHVWLRTDRSARECVVGVADDGPGVPLAEADRLFQKFSRLRTTAETPGTGLGLYITKGIVEAHNGRVWVESVPGQGATFLFAIPLESSERAVAIGEPVA
ncbi:MAG: hypothetical protein HY329_14415, partial [Chloroflexi bacterium]|nr:hypothetical protein [Chloroflexota bacterium]